MTNEQLQAVIAELTKQNAELQAKAKKSTGGPSCKVTEKGAVSFYGVGRFPVTLYKTQWEKLIGNIDMVKQFLTDNDAKLSVKEDKKTPLKVVA
jgi:hypothetical protein